MLISLLLIRFFHFLILLHLFYFDLVFFIFRKDALALLFNLVKEKFIIVILYLNYYLNLS